MASCRTWSAPRGAEALDLVVVPSAAAGDAGGAFGGAGGVALLKQKQEGRTSFLPRAARVAPSLVGPLGLSGWTGPDAQVATDMSEGSGGGLAISLAEHSALGAGALQGPPPGVLGRLVDLIEVPAEYRALAEAQREGKEVDMVVLGAANLPTGAGYGVGQVEADGDIYVGGSRWGQAQGCRSGGARRAR